ncbi:MAG: CoA transferase [Anaerolineae bacterium]|nr:CoA transferase [Anaerolineae bacterium]
MGPLASLKILDFTTLLPGPFGTMMLADLGADVIRIESPTRIDLVRAMPPFDDQGTAAWHGVLGRNKRSLALDLKQPGAAAVILRLVATYDIVLEGFRPGVMDRLGIGYEALKAVNPRLIYCAVTGYGQTGPLAQRAGHDNNYLALAGVMSHMGTVADGPKPLSLQIADIGGGAMGAVIGVLSAEIQRRATGQGQFVDVSMYDMAWMWNALAAGEQFVSGSNPQREGGLLNGGTFYGYYRTADDRFLSIGSLEPKFWAGLCAGLERPDLVEVRAAMSPAAQRRLRDEIAQTIATKSLAEWMAIFEPLDVCVEPVLTVDEAAAHPQAVARDMIVDVPRPDGGTQRQIGRPLKFSHSTAEYRHAGTAAGAATDAILTEIGYSQGEIEKLRQAGLFGRNR